MGGRSQARKKIIPICCRESRQGKENGEQIFPRMQNSNSVCVCLGGGGDHFDHSTISNELRLQNLFPIGRESSPN